MLEAILANKRREVTALRRRVSMEPLINRLAPLPATHSLTNVIRQQSDMAVIAEIKRRSPSKGVLNDSLDPVDLARTYDRAGATGISVLTDRDYFSGSLDDLTAVRRATALPILRKDFIIDEVQLYESRAAGTDVVLLIVAALDQTQLQSLYLKATELGLEALVEVHTEKETRRALDIGATMIGINNRNLQTFEVNLETTFRLAPLLPESVTLVSESGIRTRGDIDNLRQAGVRAVLVGECLVTSPNPAAKIRELQGSIDDAR